DPPHVNYASPVQFANPVHHGTPASYDVPPGFATPVGYVPPAAYTPQPAYTPAVPYGVPPAGFEERVQQRRQVRYEEPAKYKNQYEEPEEYEYPEEHEQHESDPRYAPHGTQVILTAVPDDPSETRLAAKPAPERVYEETKPYIGKTTQYEVVSEETEAPHIPRPTGRAPPSQRAPPVPRAPRNSPIHHNDRYEPPEPEQYRVGKEADAEEGLYGYEEEENPEWEHKTVRRTTSSQGKARPTWRLW
ncbi:hypothetical protein FRC17_005558, partial [Serendipita sp. 399]